MRVLVIGGTGYIGPELVRRLASRGHEVTVFHRGLTQIELPEAAGEMRGDRNRLTDYRDAFRALHPQVVVDVIAYTAKQAEMLVGAFRGIAERTVVLSSGDVYRGYDIFRGKQSGPVEPSPFSEMSPLREQLYPYRGVPMPQTAGIDLDNYEKIEVERMVMGDRDLPPTVLRLPMVYGPGDREGAKRQLFPYLKRMDDGREAILLDHGTANWRAPRGCVEDIAEAVCLAVANEQAAGQIYNVAEPDGVTLADRIRELAAAAGWHGKLVLVNRECPPPNLPWRFNRAQHLIMDSGKIRRELGYAETISRREALERTVAWDREYPPAKIDPAQFDYAAGDAILAAADVLN